MKEGDVIDVFGDIGEEVGDMLAALAVLFELPSRLDDAALVFFAPPTKGLHIHGLAIHANHVGLVIKGVDVAGPTIHEQEDDTLGLARVMGLLGGERIEWTAVPRSGLGHLVKKAFLG